MKVKVSEATGPALDWLVAKGEGKRAGWEYTLHETIVMIGSMEYRPSIDWAQGGPIIEREEIGLRRNAPSMPDSLWEAMGSITAKGAGYRWAVGPTPLIAAMRCFVASKLGNEPEVPEELT